MAIQNESDFCSCNTNKQSWQNLKRTPMYVYTDKLDTVFNNHTRKILAATLDNGIKNSSCSACWDLESAGQQSPRLKYNKMFNNVQSMADQPRVLVIKPGNTCNFACRMCNPVTSSNWYRDGYELEKLNLESSSWYSKEKPQHIKTITFNEYTKTFETIRNSFNGDHEDFWQTAKDWLKNLVYIDIYGGEPFLIPAMFDLLQHGVDTGACKNITVSIHTNCSINNVKYLEILSHYKSVNFAMSVDSCDPAQLEYIRHHADSNCVIENINLFKRFFQSFHNVNTRITYTVTPLNIYYIDRDLEQIKKMFEIPVGINLVTTPEYDIRHLPHPIKNYIIDSVKSSIIVEFLKQTIPGCDVEWPKFCRATNSLDKFRNQNFREIFPDWWKLLEPYWIK
jgi:MoaA/NifB/PqqE/SkfB family radical SAM enzyme